MTYQSYDLSRYFDGDPAESTLITVAGVDTVNCAHLLAAGFNTMSRSMMNSSVLAVVDTKAGTVQYDGKIEKFDRSDKRRDLLESAYAELQAVKAVLENAGVETIPADAGVKDLLAVKRAMSEQISELKAQTVSDRIKIVEMTAHDCGSNAGILYRDARIADARAELIEYVKRERAKWKAAEEPVNHEHMSAWFRGMLDVLAKFLAVTGEADASEGHAVARRLCGISDE